LPGNSRFWTDSRHYGYFWQWWAGVLLIADLLLIYFIVTFLMNFWMNAKEVAGYRKSATLLKEKLLEAVSLRLMESTPKQILKTAP